MSTRLGILSDTHGHPENCRAGLEVLQAAGATHFVHCGDIGDGQDGRLVCDQLAGTDCRLVRGNCDWDFNDLAAYARDLDLQPMGDWGQFTLAGKTFVLTHGDDRHRVWSLLDGRDPPDYLLTGHTHEPHDHRQARGSKTRWINPGALFRARPKTVAVLEIETDTLELLDVPGI